MESLKVGQTVGCSINKDGELRYFIDGRDQGVGWSGLPLDKPMWGFADIYGLARKIKSEFLCGKFNSYTAATMMLQILVRIKDHLLVERCAVLCGLAVLLEDQY